MVEITNQTKTIINHPVGGGSELLYKCDCKKGYLYYLQKFCKECGEKISWFNHKLPYVSCGSEYQCLSAQECKENIKENGESLCNKREKERIERGEDYENCEHIAIFLNYKSDESQEIIFEKIKKKAIMILEHKKYLKNLYK